MRLLIVVAIILLIVLAILGDRALKRREERRLRERHGWAVVPITTEEGHRQAWLIRPGNEDFLFDTVYRDENGLIDETKWDRVLYDAEAMAMEYDRIRMARRIDR